MDYETLKFEVEDRVAVITLNRPQIMNAINAQMFAELKAALETVKNDPEMRAILFAGEGNLFSSGLDVAEFQRLPELTTSGIKGMVCMLQDIFSEVENLEKPVIAAIQGLCFGAAMELCLTSDIRFAAEDAVFGLLEMKFGIIPDLGGIKKLTRLMGPGLAKELIFTGDTISAPEAYRVGMIEHLTPVGEAKEQAMVLAKRLAAGPTLALGLAKKVTNRSLDATVEECFELDQLAQTICVRSEDFQEAVNAFMQKRKPEFKGS